MKYAEKTIDLAEMITENCTACGRCLQDCLFLQKYCENPQELFERFLKEDLDPIIPYSCLLCGRCTVVCPLKLQLDEAFLAIRQDLYAENKKLPLKQLKGVTLHQYLSTSKLFTIVKEGR